MTNIFIAILAIVAISSCDQKNSACFCPNNSGSTMTMALMIERNHQSRLDDLIKSYSTQNSESDTLQLLNIVKEVSSDLHEHGIQIVEKSGGLNKELEIINGCDAFYLYNKSQELDITSNMQGKISELKELTDSEVYGEVRALTTILESYYGLEKSYFNSDYFEKVNVNSLTQDVFTLEFLILDMINEKYSQPLL